MSTPKKPISVKLNSTNKHQGSQPISPELFTTEDGTYRKGFMVVGLGRFGINVINEVKQRKLLGITRTIAIDSDADALARSTADVNIQLGDGSRTEGHPDIARILAWTQRDEILQAIHGSQLVFIVAGLGGGTGSGATHIIAKLTKQSGALAVVLANIASDQGKREVLMADKWLRRIQMQSHTVVKITAARKSALGVVQGHQIFGMADGIEQSLDIINGLSLIPNNGGIVGLDFEDIKTVLGGDGEITLYGWGFASGFGRATAAVRQALDSGDMATMLHKAAGLVIWIGSAEDVDLNKVKNVLDEVRAHCHEDSTLIFGTTNEEKTPSSTITVGILARIMDRSIIDL